MDTYKVREVYFGINRRVYSRQEGIKRIDYHEPVGPGDQHYCDISYENGRICRVFDLKTVLFEK